MKKYKKLDLIFKPYRSALRQVNSGILNTL